MEVLGLSNVKQKHTTKVTLAGTRDLQVIRLILLKSGMSNSGT